MSTPCSAPTRARLAQLPSSPGGTVTRSQTRDRVIRDAADDIEVDAQRGGSLPATARMPPR